MTFDALRSPQYITPTLHTYIVSDGNTIRAIRDNKPKARSRTMRRHAFLSFLFYLSLFFRVQCIEVASGEFRSIYTLATESLLPGRGVKEGSIEGLRHFDRAIGYLRERYYNYRYIVYYILNLTGFE